MSAHAGEPAASRRPGGDGGGVFARLRDALVPRGAEQEPPASRRRWRIETAVLVAVGLFLLIAVANDLARQSGVNERLNADLATWRQYTGHDYHSVAIDTQLLGRTSKHEVVCGNTTPGPPKERTQICLMVYGPIRHGVRPVHGGWFLPPRSEDVSALRYGCFGGGAELLPAVSATAEPLAAAPRLQTGAAVARWWPLAALTLLGAVLRLSTLDLQSFWYDEAFTVVRDLHASLGSTLHSVVHTENNPPLWYLIAWADSRVLGTGAVALRLPSALCGIALVPVVWAIGSELAGRRTAILLAALVAVNPLYVWYGQEARPYGLFLFTAALAMLCFLRADREPTRSRMALFALSGALALLSHYFAVFLLAGMCLWLLREAGARRRAALPAIAALVLAGLALLPLLIAQGGHGTQWIGRWALSSRLQAIPQYYLTGYSGSPLGRGVELLVALPVLVGLALGVLAYRRRPGPAAQRGAAGAGDGGAGPARPDAAQARAAGGETPAPDSVPAAAGRQREAPGDGARSERDALLLLLVLIATGVLVPFVLALLGADYLAPRNLVAAMIPVSAAIAVIVAAPRTGRAGVLAGAAIVAASLAITIDVNLSPRLQRGDWRALAHAIGRESRPRAITTVQLGETPLQYYLPGLRSLHTGRKVLVDEIDETGYAPLRRGAGRPPFPGFRLVSRRDVHGLIVMRFLSAQPRPVSVQTLRRHVITEAHPEVLAARNARVST